MNENNTPKLETDNNVLPDPFANIATGPDFRLNVDVMTDDIMTIQSVAPSRGVKQRLVASYVRSIADELRKRGITHYSPDNIAVFRAIVQRRNDWERQIKLEELAVAESVSRHTTATTSRKKSKGHDAK